jgi:NOL1/NOP2/fmu family ribosome biogenesis protein
MKLRIKGESLRLRITPSEMARLMESGRIDETIHLGAGDDDRLTYAIEISVVAAETTVRHLPREIAVIVPETASRTWAGGSDVGIYAAVALGSRVLEVAVEKDYACLDKGLDNRDTFPNPREGRKC